MKDREETNLDQSLKNMDEYITWDDERQQHSREILLSKMEQEKSPKRSWLKRSAVPVAATILFLGTAGTLFVSEFSEQQQLSEQQNEQQVNMAENSSGQGFGIGMDEKAESDVMEISESGFDLQLPQYSPVENTELESIWHRSEGQNNVVSATYYDGEGNELFTFMQEAITENTDVTHLQENADYETEVNGNITFVIENDTSGLRTINIITNDYGFTLSTYNLSEEQLLTTGESIE